MKKYNSNQSGRSMIEMLGVLAIVGVLSVAGIAGYSKAMEAYKFDKLVDEMVMISSNIITLMEGQNSYKGLTTESAISLGVFPENMVKSDGSVRNAFGGNIYIRAVSYAGIDGGAFTVDFDGLPQKVAIKLGTDGVNEQNQNLMYLSIN